MKRKDLNNCLLDTVMYPIIAQHARKYLLFVILCIVEIKLYNMAQPADMPTFKVCKCIVQKTNAVFTSITD